MDTLKIKIAPMIHTHLKCRAYQKDKRARPRNLPKTALFRKSGTIGQKSTFTFLRKQDLCFDMFHPVVSIITLSNKPSDNTTQFYYTNISI
jgi:hypothetical protein